MAASKVVVVESPAKAKTINKYLGEEIHIEKLVKKFLKLNLRQISNFDV